MTTTSRRQPAEGQPGIDSRECAEAWTMLRSIYTRINGRLEDAFARQLGITINEFEVLLCVSGGEPGHVRLGDLQAATPLSQPALSRLVTRLEGQGLLCRRETVADRRVVLLAMTEAGREALARGMRLHAEIIHALLGQHLTEDEQRGLVETLSRLNSAERSPG